MYYEYLYTVYLIPLVLFILYTVMIIGRKEILPRIYMFRHTLTRYVIENIKRRREYKWLANFIGSSIIISLILLSLAMPYTLERKYVSAEQSVEATLTLKRKIPVIILLDASGSMKGTKMYNAIKTVKGFIDRTIDKVLIGLIVFSDIIMSTVPPTDNRDLLVEKLVKINPGGGTVYSRPLKTAYKWLLPYTEFNLSAIIIFVTDGLPFAPDIPRYREVVYKCAEKNITIFTVFIETPGAPEYQNMVAMQRLKEMAVLTGGEAYSVENADEMAQVFDKLARETLMRAGNYVITTKIEYPIDEKIYIVQPYIALSFSALVIYSVLRALLYKITF